MAYRALYTTLGFPAAIAAGIVSTIRIPTGPCVPYMQPTNSAMAGFPLAPGVVPMSTLATRPLNASASPSSNGQNSSSFATTSGSTSNDYVFQVRPQTSLTRRGVDNGSAYVGAGGRETSVCGQAEIFTLQGNTLSTDGLWVSATSKTSWTWFAVSAQIGEMVTNFTLADGYLTWSNQAFDGGVADFCATNKTVVAVYNGTAPTNCVPVRLFAIQTTFALCNDTNTATTTSVTSNSFNSSVPASTDATHSIRFTADPSTLDVSPTLSFGSANSITISRSSAYDTDTPSSSSIATTTGPSNSSATVSALSASPPNISSTKPVFNSVTELSMSSKPRISSLDPSSIGTNSSVTTESSATQALDLSATRSNTPSSSTSPTATSSASLSSSTTSASTSTSTSQTTSQTTSSTSAPPSTSSPSSTAAPTSQATATSSPTSTYTYTTGVRLSHPTPLIANAVDSIQYDDVATNASVNFPIQLYEQRARNFTVTTNGLFAVGFADIAADTINTALYASALPPGTVCVFWKDLVAGPTAHQGIYYQIDVYGANSQLSVEYILSSYVDPANSTSIPTQIYHAILVYDYDAFGLVELYYFSDGDGGADATIGAQGSDANHNPRAAQYVYNTTVAAGDRINLVTDLNTSPNGTATLRSFAVDCYGPGTWPVGTCH